MFTADTLQGMLPLARLKREFLRECAGGIPLAVGQMDWRSFEKCTGGVNGCLQESRLGVLYLQH